MKTIQGKREREKRVVGEMIRIYCRGNHHCKDLCPGCAELLRYASERSDLCPFLENKTFCSNCKIHCYRKERREQIRRVMRYAGPRMLWRHPILAIRHVIESHKEKGGTV